MGPDGLGKGDRTYRRPGPPALGRPLWHAADVRVSRASTTFAWCDRARGGAGLQYSTGSKAHNIRTRTVAGHLGLKLSGYGLFETEGGKRVAFRSEDDVYARLGLPWIPPTLREERGEIEAGLRGELPEAVTEGDIGHPRS